MGVGLLVGIWVARYLGPGLYGQFSYALAFTFLLSPLATLGLDSVVVRRMVLDRSCRDQVLGTAFWLSLASGVVVFVVAIAGIYLVRPDETLTRWLVGVTAAGMIPQAFLVIEYWYESQVQAKFTVYAKLSAFLLASLAKVGLIVVHAPLIAFAWAGLAEVMIGAAGLLLSYRLNGLRITSWRFSRSEAGKLLRDGMPLLFAAAMHVISMRIDQVMLGEMVGSEEVGVYSAAVRLTEPWSCISFAICTSAFPAIMESWSTNRELFEAQVQKLYNLMALVGYAVAIPMTFLSGWLVESLFGSAYAAAGPLLAVLIWSCVINSLSSARTTFLISMNWSRMLFLSLLLGTVLNIVLNYLLIPGFGAMGAVVATLISYWFSLHGVCFFIKPLRATGWMLTKAILYPKVW